jgi:hypothetical protein
LFLETLAQHAAELARLNRFCSPRWGRLFMKLDGATSSFTMVVTIGIVVVAIATPAAIQLQQIEVLF